MKTTCKTRIGATERLHGTRLLRLAAFLEALPRKKFDYTTWGKKLPTCGTVACALGWGCTLPFARKAGARLTFNPFHKDEYEVGAVGYYSCEFGDFGEDPGEKVYGQQGDDFEMLFYPEGSRCEVTLRPGMKQLGDKATPKQVAKNIRAFVFDKYGLKEVKEAA